MGVCVNQVVPLNFLPCILHKDARAQQTVTLSTRPGHHFATAPLTRRLLLDVDATLGVLTGLSAGIAPLGVDILLYCLAEDDEGLIYEMRY